MGSWSMGFVRRHACHIRIMDGHPTLLAVRCNHLQQPMRKFPWLCLACFLVLATLFCAVGLLVDLSVFGAPVQYVMLLPGLGLVTLSLIVLRISLAIWWTPRASDAVASLAFLAAFILLHAYVIQQVGLTSNGSAFYAARTAVQRRLEVPLPQKAAYFEDIYTWFDKWADDWIPEDTSGWKIELQPGWDSWFHPTVWTQRVSQQQCGYWNFAGPACTAYPELNDDTEMTDPWHISGLASDAPMTLEHHSGSFLNFRGQTKMVPAFAGELGSYRFSRGYLVTLANNESGYQLINRSSLKTMFSRMRQAEFIDRHTRLVYMKHTMVHAGLNQWMTFRVLFEVGLSGLIEPSLKIHQGRLQSCKFWEESMNRPPYDPRMVSALEALGGLSKLCSGPEDCEETLRSAGLPRDEFSCSHIGASRYEPAALAFFLRAADKIFFPIMESSPAVLAALFALVAFLVFEEITQMALQGRAYFTDVSNYVELLTLVDVFLIFERTMAQMAATPQDGQSWELYTNNIEILQGLCGIACFTWWMRMLNFVSKLHPRMRVLIQTMQSAWLDLVFFCILFGIVLFSFSTTFHIWFAGTEADFRTIVLTFFSLFRGLTGDITVEPLVKTWYTAAFYILYVVLSMLIMVNVFIAIISSSFEGQQQEVETLIEQRARQALELDKWILQDPRGRAPDGQDEAPGNGDVLKVVLWCGHSLRQSDWLGLADPYATLVLRASGEERQERKDPETVRLQLGDSLVAFEAARVQSQVVEQSVDPEWNHKGLFRIPRGAADTDQLELVITVADKDAVVDDFMGEAVAPLSQLLKASDTCASMSVDSGRSMVCRYVCPSGSKGDKVMRHLLKVYRKGSQAGAVEVSAVLHSARDGDEASAVSL